jgi:hypothetical protein
MHCCFNTKSNIIDFYINGGKEGSREIISTRSNSTQQPRGVSSLMR